MKASIGIGSIVLLIMASAGLADDWDRAQKDVAKYRKEIARILGKAAPGGAKALPRKLADLEKALERGIRFLERSRRTKELKEAEKLLDLVERFGKGPARAFVKLDGEFAEYRKRLESFAKKAEKEEEGVLETLDDLIGELRSSAGKVESGREDPAAALSAIEAWRKKGEDGVDDALDELADEAGELFGKGAKPLSSLARHAKRARSGRGGAKTMDAILKAMKSGVSKWEDRIDDLADDYRKEYANLLEGSRGHREVLSRKKELDGLISKFTGSGGSANTFERDRRVVVAGAERIAASVRSGREFRPGDLAPLTKRLDSVLATCRKHRLSPPDWVEETRAGIRSLGKAGDALEMLEAEFEALVGEVERFRDGCEEGVREIEGMLDGADSFEDIIAAKKRMDRLESGFESDRKAIDGSIGKVEKLADSVSRLRKGKSAVGPIVAAFQSRAGKIGKRLSALARELERDEDVEAMLEGYDGK